MKNVTIQSVNDFHKHIQAYGRKSIIYRGVSDKCYSLTPPIGRLGLDGHQLRRTEKMLLARFKREALPHLSFQPEDDWDWLSIAQHYGLPTRLLDWSHSALVATFFAVVNDFDSDAAVYAYNLDYFIDREVEPDPFSGKPLVQKFYPKHISNRIKAQSGLFTIHRNPLTPLKHNKIERIIIPSELKDDFRTMLFRYGIVYSTLFPDLDGLCKHLRWIISDRINAISILKNKT